MRERSTIITGEARRFSLEASSILEPRTTLGTVPPFHGCGTTLPSCRVLLLQNTLRYYTFSYCSSSGSGRFFFSLSWPRRGSRSCRESEGRRLGRAAKPCKAGASAAGCAVGWIASRHRWLRSRQQQTRPAEIPSAIFISFPVVRALDVGFFVQRLLPVFFSWRKR